MAAVHTLRAAGESFGLAPSRFKQIHTRRAQCAGCVGSGANWSAACRSTRVSGSELLACGDKSVYLPDSSDQRRRFGAGRRAIQLDRFFDLTSCENATCGRPNSPRLNQSSRQTKLRATTSSRRAGDALRPPFESVRSEQKYLEHENMISTLVAPISNEQTSGQQETGAESVRARAPNLSNCRLRRVGNVVCRPDVNYRRTIWRAPTFGASVWRLGLARWASTQSQVEPQSGSMLELRCHSESAQIRLATNRPILLCVDFSIFQPALTHPKCPVLAGRAQHQQSCPVDCGLVATLEPPIGRKWRPVSGQVRCRDCAQLGLVESRCTQVSLG